MSDNIQINVKFAASIIAIIIFLASIITFAVRVEADNGYQDEKILNLEKALSDRLALDEILNNKIDKLIVQGATNEIKVTRIEKDIQEVKERLNQ